MQRIKIQRIAFLLSFLTIVSFAQLPEQQNWILHPGENLWSTYLVFGNEYAVSVCHGWMETDKLIYMQDENGNRLEKIDGEWVDGIGRLYNTEGYIISLTDSSHFLWYAPQGRVELPFTIELQPGMNIISIPSMDPYDASILFEEIMNDNVLVYAENSDGAIIDYRFEHWYFGFQFLWPGQGYKLWCRNYAEITFKKYSPVDLQTNTLELHENVVTYGNFDLLGRKIK